MDTKILQEGINVSVKKGVLTMRLHNPKKKNSITNSSMQKIQDTLDEATEDDTVKVVFFTSTGEIFSSGNDFNNFSNKTFDQAIEGFEKFVNKLINFPKVLIAGVNGAAIGVSFTMLSLFDIVLCSDTAFFSVPFIQTFQTPEGCSSLLFPLLLGKSNAGHLLLNGGVLTAADAKQLGFVSFIYEKDSFDIDAWDYVLSIAKHPTKHLRNIKRIINKNFAKILTDVNKEESAELRKSWDQPEFKKIMKKFVKNPKF